MERRDNSASFSASTCFEGPIEFIGAGASSEVLIDEVPKDRGDRDVLLKRLATKSLVHLIGDGDLNGAESWSR